VAPPRKPSTEPLSTERRLKARLLKEQRATARSRSR
jgi:hypothetical protein